MQVGVLGPGGDGSGDVIFQVSWDQVLTPSEIDWGGSARWGVHQRHLQNALTEFEGRDPDTMTFELYISTRLGVGDPMGLIWKLFNYERAGTPLFLTIGEHGYGRWQWVIVSHRTLVKYTDREGNIIAASVTLNLQEYLRE